MNLHIWRRKCIFKHRGGGNAHLHVCKGKYMLLNLEANVYFYIWERENMFFNLCSAKDLILHYISPFPL